MIEINSEEFRVLVFKEMNRKKGRTMKEALDIISHNFIVKEVIVKDTHLVKDIVIK